MPDRHLYITKSTSIAPADGIPFHWLVFLFETTGSDTDLLRYIQQMCGYILTGDISEHALFFIYGPGGNGKSVFLNTLIKIMGDYAVTAAMETFTASKTDRHPTDLAMLCGARLVAVSETEEGRAWAESRIKQLTGGDRISARFMRQDYFSFVPQFKLVIIGNHKPRLHNVDDAMRRRIHIIPFTHVPANQDKHLEDKLRVEYPQILNWMIEGAKDWQANGFLVPAVVHNATDEYFAAQDLFGQWLDECCETGPSHSTAGSALFENWKGYAEHRGERPGTMPSFADNLTKRGFEKRKTRAANVYDGIALKKDMPPVLYVSYPPGTTGPAGSWAFPDHRRGGCGRSTS
jgi:putative DNA primase/helicase